MKDFVTSAILAVISSTIESNSDKDISDDFVRQMEYT